MTTADRLVKALAILPAVLLAAQASIAQESREAPRRLGLVEESGVTLLLLDVEAVDGKGRPLPGLSPADFSVSLGGKSWKIYSVDDLCPCSRAPEPGAAAGSRRKPPPAGGPDPGEGGTGGEGAATERLRFILYLDFSQLRMDGRLRTLHQARRWVREVRSPGDEVMIVGYTSLTGVKRLTEMTDSEEALTGALERARDDHDLIEAFPQEVVTRTEECENDRQVCGNLAMEEYYHGRASLRALSRFMTAVEELPGRKAVVYFHENGMMMPGAPYGVKTPHHLRLVQELGAGANRAHASLHTVNVGAAMGAIGGQAVTLGLNLADLTGGRFNRGGVDMAGFLDATGKGCRCLYRLGLVPPESPKDRVYLATVRTGDHVSPHRYAVRFLSEADRWMQRARLVLDHPGDAREIPVTSAIVPLRASRRRWDVAVQIALDTASLTLLPGGEGLGGEWETGVLLHDEDGGEVHELLGVYQVRQGTEAGGTVLHERRLAGLKPGTYRLRAFVRDRTAGIFGGTEAVLSLPHPRKGGLAGPVWMSGPRRRLMVPLPLLKGGGRRDPDPATIAERLVPAGDQPVLRGEALEAHTWFCPGKDASPEPDLRYVTSGTRPLVRFEHGTAEPAGSCTVSVDRLEPASLPPGSYVYHLAAPPERGSLHAGAPFRVAPPGP